MTLDSPLIERLRGGEGYRLVYEDEYATGIHDLFAALTDPERLARWMADYSGELALGGTWHVADRGGEPWGSGTVTACDAPRGFTTTWRAGDEPETELVVRLDEVEGGTRLTLTHTGIRSDEYGAGWQTYLERLARHAADPAGPEAEDAWTRRFDELAPGYAERFARA